MFVPASVKCDICEIPHEKTNGWYSITFGGEPEAIEISHFREEFAETHAAVCGEKCLHTYLSQNLSKLNKE